jgi:hypothetical protein
MDPTPTKTRLSSPPFLPPSSTYEHSANTELRKSASASSLARPLLSQVRIMTGGFQAGSRRRDLQNSFHRCPARAMLTFVLLEKLGGIGRRPFPRMSGIHLFDVIDTVRVRWLRQTVSSKDRQRTVTNRRRPIRDQCLSNPLYNLQTSTLRTQTSSSAVRLPDLGFI